MPAARIRVTGIVQGVGFRPFVWRLANECGVTGQVWNDAEGVLIEAWGNADALEVLLRRLRSESPPLACIENVACTPLVVDGGAPAVFRIAGSHSGAARTAVAPDAATCPDCLSEVLDPANRRYRYPFTNCTHCGPRLSIVHAIPYDRANTSMAVFPMCPRCQREYDDPADRRFHAQPNACADCGPQVWLEDAAGGRLSPGDGDVIAEAARLIQQGSIIAIKGIGGVHLACDACNEVAVAALRKRKQRYHKALALMARDVAMASRFARVCEQEAVLLRHRAAPIVVLDAAGESLAPGISPGQNTLGFMLPYTPLHHLLMRDLSSPLVMTSGNRSDEPQVITNGQARQKLAGIADYFLLHDRDIVNRLDDSVVRIVAARPRFLRRARGYAPQPIALPAGFDDTPAVLAMGGELKNTFCLLREGQAILSQHIGDLEDANSQRDYRRQLALYTQLFDHRPGVIAVDRHPDYLSTQVGLAMAAKANLPVVEVQHHHAHIAACMADSGLARDHGKVLGVALDGLGLGSDGTLWGGEFLLADYYGYTRIASFQAIPMPGGAWAAREPWRNTLAHLCHTVGWERVESIYADLEIVRFLRGKPLDTFETMMEKGINSPAASSCGRLFDAVAAAVGVCREAVSHEGQAAMELEALATAAFPGEAGRGYPCEFSEGVLDWTPLWEALLTDLQRGVEPATIAARFHQGLARGVAEAAGTLSRKHKTDKVVLGGGVFHNRLLLESISDRLALLGFEILSPLRVSAGDGGLALGQAVVAAARLNGIGEIS